MNISNRPDISQLLMNMRDLRQQVQTPGQSPAVLDVKDRLTMPGTGGVEATPGFSQMFSQAINSVNELQQNAGQLSSAYAQGDQSVDLADVMIASEKSKVAFQATIQVRNKVVEAYQDIMNMPI
ncbi:flagellar hook-basal body complex protein FliE [Halioxenophilus sp. WMMB6]|uniref:flagellar hook-basal body complex protein FliE n=1 Tax=Halioxenophilus sp. WMMB6 TaxID=3073815 RepID=UPI00295E6F59|nr:flagellar hook-basal body complex protein FliE [Halioxenophilus sp. WMMB6]